MTSLTQQPQGQGLPEPDPYVPPIITKRLNQRFDEDHPDEGMLGAGLGQIAAIGKGAAEGYLGLARGVNRIMEPYLRITSPWAARSAAQDVGHVSDYLSDSQNMRLESRLSQAPVRGFGEGLGEAATYIGGLPGKAISGLAAPGIKLGEHMLSRLPAAAKWAKIAQATIPKSMGYGTGFGIYNYMTAEGDMEERSAAALHGLVSGAALGVLGEVANAAERTILKFGGNAASRGAARTLREDIFSNAIKREPDIALRFSAKVTSSAIEALGFSGLDKDFWKDAIAGVSGDVEAMDRATEKLAGNFVGVLIARTGNKDIGKTFRREQPDLNTFDTRMTAYEIRRPTPKPQESTQPQDPSKPKDPLLTYKQEPAKPPQEPAGEVATRLPALRIATDPLFKSGWEMKPDVEVQDGRHTVTMEFPGSGTVRMWENEGSTGTAVEGFGIEVPPEVFKAVRGDVDIPKDSQRIRMVGPVAQEFVQHLAGLSMLRRISGELFFGHNGEAWAGGPWNPSEGETDPVRRFHSIGLDGQHYTQTIFPEDGYRREGRPVMPPNDQSVAMADPQIARWVELSQAMADHTAPSLGRDLMEATIALAVGGDPNSRSVQEVRKLLATPWQEGQMNADLVGALLLPDTIDQFGLTIGQVAAGHLTADRAAEQLGTVLMARPKGNQLQAPAEGQAAPEGGQVAPAEPDAGIAGSRDWSVATAAEKREGATQHTAQFPDTKTADLADTFLISRDTARDVLGKSREGERGSIDLGPMAQAIGAAARDVKDIAIESSRKLVSSQPRALAAAGKQPGTDLSREIRSATAYKRALIGKAGEEGVKAVKAAKGTDLGSLVKVDIGNGKSYEQLKWVMAAQGMLKEPTPQEAKAGIHARNALLTLQRNFAASGGMYSSEVSEVQEDGTTKTKTLWLPAQKRTQAIVPIQYSNDPKVGFYKLMEHPADRRAWFENQSALNPRMYNGEPLTGAVREAAYLKRKSKAADVDDPEHIAAVEMRRMDLHTPAVFDAPSGIRYQIREPDMAKALHAIIERQGGRVAAIRAYGQDVGKKAKLAMGYTREGVSGRLERFNRDIENASDIENKDEVKALAKRMMDRLQGNEPEPASALSRAVNELYAVPTAMAVWTAGMLDLPAFLEIAPYAGWKNMFKALWDAIGDRLSTEEARRFGSLAHEIGNLDAGLSSGPLSRIAEVLSTPSNWLEGQKTALFDRAAKFWLESMAKGKPRADDFDVLTRLLKFSPQQALQLVGGTASPELQREARFAFVTDLASRGRAEERSQIAANPTARAWVKFLGYATKRLEKIATELVEGAKQFGDPKSTMAQRGRAAQRLGTRLMLLGITGIAGKLLAYLWAGIFQGENGYKKLAREMSEFPGQTLAKSVIGGVLAGPFGTSSSALLDKDPERIGQVIAPINMVTALFNSVARGHSPFDMAGRMAIASGIVPKELPALLNTLQAAYVGTLENEQIAREVQQWKRLSGYDSAFSTPPHQAEFYAATRRTGELIGKFEGNDFDKLWEATHSDIQKALDLQPNDTVAGKLRSMAFLFGLNPKQVDDLQRFVGPETYLKILRHDGMLNALARRAGHESGTYPDPWVESVAMAGRQAQAGAENSWGKLIDRAVDDMADQITSQSPATADIDELAYAIADYPEAAAKESSFSEDDRKKIGDPNRDREDRARRAAHIMMERAKAAAKRDRKFDRAEEKRLNSK